MTTFLKNNWQLLLIAFLLLLTAWTGYTLFFAGSSLTKQKLLDKQRQLDSAYERIQRMKQDSAKYLSRQDSIIAKAAEKEYDLKIENELITAKANQWQAEADANEEKYNEAVKAGDQGAQLRLCPVIIHSYDSFKVAVTAERQISTERLQQAHMQLLAYQGKVAAVTTLWKATDSALTAEHQHGLMLTTRAVQQDKTIRRQRTFIEVLAAGLVAVVAALFIIK